MKTNILIVAGGTGGHIIPAITIGKELKDYNIYYVCGKREIENKIYSEYNIEPIKLNIPSYNKFIVFYILGSFIHSINILRKNNINIVFMMGSYFASAIGLASIIMHKTIILYEQDSIAGKVIKIFSLFASRVLVGFDKAYHGINKKKIRFVGHIIRNDALLKQNENNLFNNKNTTILIMGGSQGALHISKKIVSILQKYNYNIILLAGKYKDEFQETSKLKIYTFYKKIGELYSFADIIISRAGALSIAEILNTKKPALFIPLKIATHNHQLKNVLFLKKQYNHIDYILEDNIQENILLAKIESLINKSKPNYNVKNTMDLIKEELINYV